MGCSVVQRCRARVPIGLPATLVDGGKHTHHAHVSPPSPFPLLLPGHRNFHLSPLNINKPSQS